MSDRPAQRPEGKLIETAMLRKGMSTRSAAPLAGISEARWRQIVSGYQSAGRGVSVPVIATPRTLAKMARAVGVTEEQLITAGREDAAEVLRDLGATSSEDVRASDTPAFDELTRIRDDVSLPGYLRRQAQAQLDLLAGLMEAASSEHIGNSRQTG
jgi:hypothetical protein